MGEQAGIGGGGDGDFLCLVVWCRDTHGLGVTARPDEAAQKDLRAARLLLGSTSRGTGLIYSLAPAVPGIPAGLAGELVGWLAIGMSCMRDLQGNSEAC